MAICTSGDTTSFSGRAGRLVLVDGHGYAYRAFHAIRSLNGPTGQATNAIFGFIKMMERLKAGVKPTHWAVVWDGGLAAERLALLPEYKAQRPPMPESLGEQIEQINRWLLGVHIQAFVRDGVEADDLIAGLAKQGQKHFDSVVVATSDKDFMQLVNDVVGLVNPADADQKIMTASMVKGKTGVAPEQIVDWLSLIGDSVDNIGGVDGIGPKRAGQLLGRFGSLKALFERLEEIENVDLRSRLKQSQPLLARNQEMIALNDRVAPVVDWNDLLVREGDGEQLRALYAEWGFKTLLEQLGGSGLRQGELFAAAPLGL